MKKITLLLLFFLITMVLCGYGRKENLFFEDSKLSFNLVPKLPHPKNASMVLVDTDHGNDSRVYINSNQSAEEYFQDCIEYIELLSFAFCGTVDSIKEDSENILGKENTYYFRSTKNLSSVLAKDYYFEKEKSFIIIYSNGNIEKNENGQYLKDAHLIRVCCTSGVYEPKSHIGDDYRFEYNYFIEFGYEPSIWLDDTIGAFKLEIIDKGDFLIDELSNVDNWYKPGTLLKFCVNPIMDADLVMYVNDNYYSKQTTIEVNDKYVWEYTFVMPEHNTIIKFELDTSSDF